MTRVIRIKEETFEELAKYGKWSDTMDMIISRILKQNVPAFTSSDSSLKK
jgi:hypothetical protein